MRRSLALTGLVSLVISAFLLGVLAAQQTRQETSIKLSGKVISVRYDALRLPGPKVFGTSIPYGQVWLASQEPILFHTDANLEVQGLEVPKGDYTLYVVPDPKEWKLVISKGTGPQAKRHDPQRELGRVPMEMKKAPAPVDPLRISLASFGRIAGKMEIAYENVIASVPFNLSVATVNPEW